MALPAKGPDAAGLYYEVHGRDDAPPLLLSSGLGGSASYWQPNLTALAEHFRVIVYDHRGTGRSRRALTEETSIGAMGEDAIALLDALQIDRCDFVGHAIGGMIGLVAAARGRIERLVVVNGWREMSPHTARCFAARLDLLRGGGPKAFLRAQPLFLFPADWIAANDALLDEEAERHLAHFPGVATVEKRIAAACTFAPDAAMLAGPGKLLAIATRDDFLVPFASALAVASGLARAQTATFDWGGHACNVTDPDRFNRLVLDFLRS